LVVSTEAGMVSSRIFSQEVAAFGSLTDSTDTLLDTFGQFLRKLPYLAGQAVFEAMGKYMNTDGTT
jgi:hypothetical protein